MEGTVMAVVNYEIELVLEGPGASHDPEFGEVVLEAFLEAAETADPVVEQNTESGRVAIDLSIAAESMADVTKIVFEVCTAALANMSPSLRIASLHVDSVGDREGDGAAVCA